MTAQAPSRPLRSFGLVLIGWIMIRAVTIWSDQPLQAAIGEGAPVSAIRTTTVERMIKPIPTIAYEDARSLPASKLQISRRTIPEPGGRSRPPILGSMSRGFAAAIAAPSTTHAAQVATTASSTPDAPIRTSEAKRWSASAWLLLRKDGSAALSTGGELGGSQVGARIFYTVAEPFAATARVSRPLVRNQGGEASAGIAIRHGNVGLLLERRVALDRGGRNDFSVTAYGGVSDIDLGHKLRLDGYAQAGIVGTDKFVDGAVRIERTVAAIAESKVSFGAGAWGGAQPGVKRVDVGPQIVAHIPVEGHTARVSAEWRERVAGAAAPTSGPALTLGIDL